MAGGVTSIGGVTIFRPDPEATNIIKIIEEERGTPFNFNERYYVNYIVTNLKASGVWDKSKAIYGMVGGTAAAHKWNWKDMRNLDAAFRLTYTGTITHSNNGMQGDGSTGFANTYFNPETPINFNNNFSCSFLGTVAVTPVNDENTDLGSSPSNLRMQTHRCLILLGNTISGNNINAVGVNVRGKGFYIGNLLGSLAGSYNDGVYIPFSFSNGSTTLGSNNVALFCESIGSTFIGSYSNKTAGFAHLGYGLTDTEAIQMSNIVNFGQKMRANF